ncbi:hypothetical protein SAMN04488074_12876 [Lentzea albidocapillata subsp. violacea]|uniref:Uncharacterized protein n=1 Tax=Lentzea albidocapillata subsp. violacea TaxID=128104 RepID=A0A1G9WUM9_9PSEU|nr:hypothetical protein SAMN04488074_12876 [Lentzea albidocapillata subsp. violacea]
MPRRTGAITRQIVTLTDGTRLAGLGAVVLAQGHIDMPLGESEQRLSRFADAHGLRYQPPANPAEVGLDEIGAGEVVAVRGMGLNFFDYLARFTIDRGGRFQRAPDGRLVYRPSGHEPDIYAGSRRGVPYHSRARTRKVCRAGTSRYSSRTRSYRGCAPVPPAERTSASALTCGRWSRAKCSSSTTPRCCVPVAARRPPRSSGRTTSTRTRPVCPPCSTRSASGSPTAGTGTASQGPTPTASSPPHRRSAHGCGDRFPMICVRHAVATSPTRSRPRWTC